MNEFGIIQQFFSQQNLCRRDVILGIGDDGAIVEIPPNKQLVITTDTLVAGVHFPLQTSAYNIGYKSLAVNLSDIAAMGATPAWITLALTLDHANENWLKEFCQGMFDLASHHQVQLIGGDLTHGPLTITIQALGLTSPNQVLQRRGAKIGDLIFVSNTLGDAALGLRFLEKNQSISKPHLDYFLTRLNRPEPRVAIGNKLLNIASSAIDISDGLAADLNHILKASDVGATIYVDQIPLSTAMIESVPLEEAYSLALNGGDDYELCFTVPKEKSNLLKNEFTCIGEITPGTKLDLQYKNGNSYQECVSGYQHTWT